MKLEDLLSELLTLACEVGGQVDVQISTCCEQVELDGVRVVPPISGAGAPFVEIRGGL